MLNIFPVFATVNGFIKIAIRPVQVFAFMQFGGEPLAVDIFNIPPFVYYVSESNLYFLIGSFFFYWIILWLVESRLLTTCLRACCLKQINP